MLLKLRYKPDSNPTLSAISFIILHLESGDTYTDSELDREASAEGLPWLITYKACSSVAITVETRPFRPLRGFE
jgi:hypothetical protein